ncbi:hypothetical protein ADK60_29865 [Streptomyces sp. XY431]|uniref:hypothetical protein n=1 Tax=Streptomyces sp. XY431 TaxID=1415562 RepID=UPI0006AF0A97|nr:hypothetical protein [Streptomyces sp. XY431]KOV13304.1 hypothetical protein ADK60_29865 [Streptomyces sp. XY431]
MTPPPPTRRARRALGPGADRVLADTVRTPRTPPPWSPAAVAGALRAELERFEATAEPWRDAFDGLDEDVLAEAASEARAFGADPAAAVDHLVSELRQRLADWQDAIGELGRELTAAAQDRPLPEWAADAGRTEDVHRRRARQALLEAIARHHHGPVPDEEPDDKPW